MATPNSEEFFAESDRLRRELDAAAAETEKLLPLAKSDNAAPWSTEPSPDAIHEKELVADAKRLAAFAPESATEISEALAVAEAARERAENLLAEHEAKLSTITGQIFALGKARKKIAIAKSLSLDDAGAQRLAHTALTFFVDRQVAGASNHNLTGFRSNIEDLSFRKVLNEHIETFTAPIKSQVVEILKTVRAEAKSAKIDLHKVLELLAAQRGKSGGEALEMDSNLYSGLV
jgi:hypothetical protein